MFDFQVKGTFINCDKCGNSCQKTGQRQKYCLICSKEIAAVKAKEWRSKNAEIVRDYEKSRIRNPEENRKRAKEWHHANPDKAKALSDKWYATNKDKAIARASEWNSSNKEKRREINKESAKRIRKQNPERFSIAKRERRKDAGVRLHDSCSAAIRAALKGNKCGYSWEFLVGYTIEQLKTHLENQFTDGMEWENYGKWHVDHIRPVSSFYFKSATDQDFLDCWSLSNLQPLWALDNIRKGNKWEGKQCAS